MKSYHNGLLCAFDEYIADKTCAVIGIGISNLPLIDFLCKRGAHVTARDKKTREQLCASGVELDRLASAGVKFILGNNYLEGLDEEIIFKTPGLRCDCPQLKAAYQNGAVVTGEMEVFLSLCPSKIIAITGSDGKTTTTTLTAKLLEKAGKRVFLGGNIGKPLLSELELMTPDDFVVLELSSFQLHSIGINPDGTQKQGVDFPDVAIITNVSPNHLDWHTSYEEYADSKKFIFKFMRSGGRLVTNASNPITSAFAKEAAESGASVSLFSSHLSEQKISQWYADKDYIYKDGQKYLRRSDIKLPGTHNAENYMAALCATSDYVTAEQALSLAREFGGVEHRLEFVADIDGAAYYNSSIDSSPSRTIAAISSFSDDLAKKLILIMGGYDKHIPYDSVGVPICKMARGVFLCGATSQAIKAAIEGAENYDKSTQIFCFSDFRETIEAARAFAKSGDRVILTPASASFDMFRNFEERGVTFKQIINELAIDANK